MKFLAATPEDGTKEMLKCGRSLLQLAVVLSLCMLSVSNVWGEDWVFYTRYGDSFFYDRKNINNPYEDFKNIIGVWQKIVYDDETVNRITAHLGAKYGDLRESISMIEIDCSKKCAQTKAITYYDVNGKIIETKHTSKEDWKEIVPKSPLNELYYAVCPQEEK
jgi:hypothetical protein